MQVTAHDLASRFLGVKEVPGNADNAQILAFLNLDAKWPQHDEVPWCSGFVNYILFLLGLPRTKDLRARSWLDTGRAVTLEEARKGDIVVLERPPNPDAGHVGFFDHADDKEIFLLAGNQGDAVSIDGFPLGRILQIRRVEPE